MDLAWGSKPSAVLNHTMGGSWNTDHSFTGKRKKWHCFVADMALMGNWKNARLIFECLLLLSFLFFFFVHFVCMTFKIKFKKLIWKYPAGDLWCLVNYLCYLHWGSHHAGTSVLIITASSMRSPSQCSHWGDKHYLSPKDFTVSGQEKRCRGVHSVCASRKSSVSLNVLTVVSIEWEGTDFCIMVFDSMQQFEENKLFSLNLWNHLPFLVLHQCNGDWYNHFMSGVIPGGHAVILQTAWAIPASCFSL